MTKRWLTVIGASLCVAMMSTVSSQTFAQGATTTRRTAISANLDSPHALSAPLNGSNLDYSGVGQPFSSIKVLDAMATFHSGTLRYPGGAISNYWSWQTGSLNQPAQTVGNSGHPRTKPARVRDYRFTLNTLHSIVTNTGTTPVFDLNVLTSNLSDQLTMLRSASALGIPVRYIELGNEFYLSDGNYTSVFPTAASYADLVAQWSPQIHAAFPHAEIAAVGSLPDTTARERTWNATVLSIAGSDINALTLHDYSGMSKSGSASLLSSAYLKWQAVQHVISSIPSRYGIWITEFNLSKEIRLSGTPKVGLTWSQGLYVADMMLQQDQSDRVQLDDFWDLFDQPSTGIYTTGSDPYLTASGDALIALTNASWDATSVTQLSFPGSPTLPGGAPGIVGVRFTGTHGDRTVLINLTNHSVTMRVGAAIPYRAQEWSVSTNSPSDVSTAGRLVRHSGTVADSLVVPAYSVVGVGYSAPSD